MGSTRFPFSYHSLLRGLFLVLGMGPSLSGIDVGPDTIRVRMGWAFRATVPRSAIRSVEPDSDLVPGWGVHGFGGTWLVNGSSRGLLRLRIDPQVRAYVVGVPVRLHILRISVEEPDALIAALRSGSRLT